MARRKAEGDATLARRAGVSLDAVALWREADFVDLHIDALLGSKIRGYDLAVHHQIPRVFGGKLFGHFDLPRVLEAGLGGAMWSVVTNPMRTPLARLRGVERALDTLHGLAAESAGRMRIVRTHGEYVAARRADVHAAMLAIQGGNVFDGAPDSVARLGEAGILRVTLVHLTRSSLGDSSSPVGRIGGDRGLSKRGHDLVERLDDARIFVDLAHASAKTVRDVAAMHDRERPLVITHTGVAGVRGHWRNVDDEQLRAIADTGGVVGVMFQRSFLRRRGGPSDGRMVVEHLAHICKVAGEGVASFGSDYDGAILPPPDLVDSTLAYLRLVQYMLDAKFSEERIRGIVGGNFARALALLRP